MVKQLQEFLHAISVLLLMACFIQMSEGRSFGLLHEDHLSHPSAQENTIVLDEDTLVESAVPVIIWEPVHSEGQVRERRSPQFRQSQFQPQRQPLPRQPQQPPQPRGEVTVDVQRQRGVGTVVSAQGSGNVWRSRDGSASLDAHGHWQRVVRGPQRSRPSYGGGITFSKRF